jgi:hypothetical protein
MAMTQRNVVLGVSAFLIALSLCSILWFVPEWQGRRLPAEVVAKDRAELVNAYRTTLAQALAGIGLLGGLYFTWRSLTVAREGQITERYTEAIAQLGDSNQAVRTGAMYALERIGRNSQIDHWPIVEVLTAYVRQKAAWKPENANRPPCPLPSDIQAALNVLAQRKWRQTETRRISLVDTDLRRAYLAEGHFEGAYLPHAHLEEATLNGAHFQRADLTNACLTGATLKGTHLHGADLTSAIGLTVSQIGEALTDKETRLPRSHT